MALHSMNRQLDDMKYLSSTIFLNSKCLCIFFLSCTTHEGMLIYLFLQTREQLQKSMLCPDVQQNKPYQKNTRQITRGRARKVPRRPKTAIACSIQYCIPYTRTTHSIAIPKRPTDGSSHIAAVLVLDVDHGLHSCYRYLYRITSSFCCCGPVLLYKLQRKV